MDNYAIADQFSLLGKLMDIHGENSFKAKSYSSTAFTIEKLSKPLAGLSEEQLAKTKGIGDSSAKKIMELLQSGQLKALQDLLKQTPTGVLDMMNIKGLGPKKIHTLWKEMHISSIEDLEAACVEHRIAEKKGFGEKTEAKILEAIEFVKGSRGKFLYKDVEDFAVGLQKKLEAKFPNNVFQITGEFKRQLEIISVLEWVTDASKEALKSYLVIDDLTISSEDDEMLILCAEDFLRLKFHLATKESLARQLFETSSSEKFLEAFKNKTTIEGESEEAIFQSAGLPFIPSYLREEAAIIANANALDIDSIVETSSIKGLIHSHSNWSDGVYTIEQMAEELIRTGFEYLVISDHSKAAAYAGGLTEERIKEQHQYIDSLNKKLAPFKIFKSIECDILGDGSLDYDDKTLASFDLVITSIHSNLDMDEDKAMLRLLGAINNPYTTILGHMTGRLLLRRKGYPVDHKTIIDACVKNKVVVEINASPYRLDMDWRWVDYAVEKGLLLSINPDAHSLDEFPYIKYGTLVAQKGGLPTSKNLSSFSLKEFEAWLSKTRKAKGLTD